MAAKGTLTVRIVGDAKSFSQTMDKVSGKVAGFAGTAARVGAAAAAAGATAVAALGVKAVGAASDLEQSMGSVESVFGDARGAIDAFAADAARKAGLSKRAVNEMASVMGASLQAFGFEAEDAAGMTVDLQQRAADMAATFGGPVEDAVSAIGALMRGEADPIEKFGVSIKQSDINARLAAEGLSDLEGEERKLAEAQARLDILFEQTASSAGTFARESGTLAGQQAQLRAEIENSAAAIGEALLPLAAKGVEGLRALAEWLGPKIEAGAARFGAAVDEVRAWWDTHGPAILDRVRGVGQALKTWWEETAVTAIFAMRDAMQAWWDGTGKRILDAAVTAWNDNKDAVVEFVTSSGTLLRELAILLGGAFSNATEGADGNVEGLSGTFGTLLESVTEIIDGISTFVGWMNKISDAMFAPLRANMVIVKAVIGGVANELDRVKRSYDSVKSVLGFGGGKPSMPSSGNAPQGGRAHGGNVTRGNWLVGERGPEVVSMGRSGSVSPIASGSGGTTTYVTVNAPNYVGDKHELMAVVKAELAKDSRRGGTLIANVARQ